MKRETSVPLWLLAVALAVPLLGLTSPLLEVDDARYAQVPAEMAASGDWIVPTLDGTAYVEKPPLWYWTAAVSYKIFGVSEGSARLAMLLFALLGVAGAWWLGSWLYEPGIGVAAAAATATASLWIFLTHNMTVDMPVSVCLLWTTALALRAMARPEDARWAAPAAWLAAALAFLSKGLISVLLPGLWVVGLAILFPKLRRGARALISPVGIALAFAVAAPWFFAVQKRRPDFFHVFFIEQHFQRFLTQRYNRNAPWWFYLAVLPAGLLPWTAPFLAGFWRAVRRPLGPDFRGPALAAWVIGVAAFFSTSHSKLATYVLPVFPHACLLAITALDEELPAWMERIQRVIGGLLLAAVAVGCFAIPLINSSLKGRHIEIQGLPDASSRILAALALCLIASLGTALIFAPSSKRPATVLAGGGALAGIFLFFGLRMAAPLVSARDVGKVVREEARAEDTVWTYGSYLHGLPFYAHRPVDKLVQFTGEFHYAKRDPAFASRFGDDSDLKKLPRAGGRTFVVLHTGERPHFAETVGGAPASIESWREFGPWSLAVVRPRAP